MLQDLWIDTPHKKIFAKTAGSAANPLVLGIHGWSQRNGWHTWEALMRPLADANYYVVSVDMPGWGQSPAWDKTVGQTAVFAILDSLGVDSAVLMGKSWGGGVALHSALAAPERVDKLILTAPAFRSTAADLERLTQPVLLAWAKDDPVIPYAATQKFVDHVNRLQLESYATGGHSAAQNNGRDFAPKAVKFLNKQG